MVTRHLDVLSFAKTALNCHPLTLEVYLHYILPNFNYEAFSGHLRNDWPVLFLNIMGECVLCKSVDLKKSGKTGQINLVSKRDLTTPYTYQYALKPSIIYVDLMYNWKENERSYITCHFVVDTEHTSWISYPVYDDPSTGSKYADITSSNMTLFNSGRSDLSDRFFFTILEIAK